MTRKLLTAEGYDTLKAELDYLLREHRPEITAVVSWAASLGDRSENADYKENKQKLRQIDRRIRHLTKLFDVAERIEYNPAQEGKVYFGAWCELENELGEIMRFRIVGDEEVYGQKNYISLKSPMAKACLSKSLDDEVNVETPEGYKQWYITDITYRQTAADTTTT
jgi:transcription elongation factor GreB